MAIRPIDMQVTLPRVSEIKESKPGFLHRDDILHDHANKSMREETIKKQKTVNKAEASAKAKVDRDRKDKERQNKKKGKDAEAGREDEERMNGPYRSIDIKI
ncbi:MAG: hypothetical protein Q4A72_03795 [Bacillota bacterium]|nr:hypothetical protein [Bacillota bacterium]